jgi:hypothetical protein
LREYIEVKFLLMELEVFFDPVVEDFTFVGFEVVLVWGHEHYCVLFHLSMLRGTRSMRSYLIVVKLRSMLWRVFSNARLRRDGEAL